MNKICFKCKTVNIYEANYCKNCGSQAIITPDNEIELRIVGIENALKNHKDIKTSADKASPESTKMLIFTNEMLLTDYKKLSDKVSDAKNFRLYYNDKATSLIWYNGKIIFLPVEYFELKNLANININKKQKCSLFASEVNLIKELEKQEIQFILEPNLKELLKRINKSGIRLDDEMAVELTDDNDYSSITEPIYMGDGVWLNIDNLEI